MLIKCPAELETFKTMYGTDEEIAKECYACIDDV